MPDRLARGETAGPRRVRVRGDLFHGVVPLGAIYVGRAAPGLPASPYANPFKAGETIGSDSELWPYLRDLPGVAGDPLRGPLYAPLTSLKITSAELAVDLFSRWFPEQPHLMIRAFAELPGRDLACWCRVGAWCHGDWMLGAVNAKDDDDA